LRAVTCIEDVVEDDVSVVAVTVFAIRNE